MAKKKGFNEYKIVDDCVIIYVKHKSGIIVEALVDLEDLDRLKESGLSWNAEWRRNIDNYYIKATKYLGNAKYKSIYLHRFILDITDGKIHVNHINHDTLNNRKSNLEGVKPIENATYRRGRNPNNTSGYRNVSWLHNKWCVQIQVEGKNTILGMFDDVHEAGKYADEMRKIHYGRFAGTDIL